MHQLSLDLGDIEVFQPRLPVSVPRFIRFVADIAHETPVFQALPEAVDGDPGAVASVLSDLRALIAERRWLAKAMRASGYVLLADDLDVSTMDLEQIQDFVRWRHDAGTDLAYGVAA